MTKGYETKCRITALLYEILRDYVTAGTLEDMIDLNSRASGFELSNINLAKYAEELAAKLKSKNKYDNPRKSKKAV